ncbi:MAG: hypothetical protein ACRELX_06500, partial [Longimicrobiales bacterium]
VRHTAGDVALFADPGFAVTRPARDAGWPIGTGDYGVESVTLAADGRASEVIGRARVPGLPRFVRFRTAGSADMRDALDAAADVLVTRDRETLAYARRLDAFDASPLPWDRSYVLLSRRTASPPALPGELLASLARDVVPGDARAAVDDDIGSPAPSCDAENAMAATSVALRPRIVYPHGDVAAAALAERLAALSGTRRHEWLAARLGVAGRVTAAGLDDAGFDAALRSGDDAGYILPLSTVGRTGDRWTATACARSDLVSLAPWLAAAGTVTPLVETRAHLVRRRGVGPVQVDAHGTFRFVPATGVGR